MEIETKVTTARIRRMRVGESVTFKLKDAAAIFSGKSLAYRMSKIEGCRFKAISDFKSRTLTIIKLPRADEEETVSASGRP